MGWLKSRACWLWNGLRKNKTIDFFFVNRKYIPESFWQLITVWVLSNVPWLLLIAFSVYGKEDADIWNIASNVAIQNFTASNLVFYVAALMAPLLWVFIDCFGKRTWVPLFKTFLFAIVIIMIILSAILFLNSIHQLNNKSLVDSTFIWFYVVAIFIWYVSIFYSKALDDAKPPLSTDSPDEILKGLQGDNNAY